MGVSTRAGRRPGAPARVSRLVGHQLLALSHWAGLPAASRAALSGVCRALTRESLNRPAQPPFEGLSRINADGLPFQWVLRFSRAGHGFGFVCEAGAPGSPPERRLSLSLDRLQSLRGGHGLAVDSPVHAISHELVGDGSDLPPGCRSAIWFGAAPGPGGVILKPYFNLNRDSPRERWLRVGRVLQALGRPRALERLCSLSGAVSTDSWPVGAAADLLPDGSIGRVKMYVRSGPVGPDWLGRWYDATGFGGGARLVRRLLDLFPWLGRQPYPAGAFVLSVEFQRLDGDLGLKTDVAATKWMASDRGLCAGARSLVEAIGGEPLALDAALAALGCSTPDAERAAMVRFVGLGSEPDGTHHVNVYLEPALAPEARATRALRSPRNPVEAALRFIVAARREAHWVDYRLPVGESDAWVTAYVLARLAELPCSSELPVADTLRWLENARTPGGGWGFNGSVEGDADSTAWAILALTGFGHPIPDGATAFLHRTMRGAGGFATFEAGGHAVGAWTHPAIDVTAVARRALHLAQDEIPSVPPPSYWWTSPLYALAAMLDGAVPDSAATALRAHLRRHRAHSAFDQALLLRCLVRLRMPEAAEAAVRLAESQNADGSWPASALLRLTRPDVDQPWNRIDSGPLFLDERAVFTTATSMSALALASMASGDPCVGAWPV